MGILVMQVPTEGAVQIRDEKDIKDLQMMVPATAEGSPQSPRWSHDGARFVYEWVKTKGGRDIYVANTDGTNLRNLTQELGGDNSQAQWAPRRK
jgi:Tol biopolymer transport system component